ncbi:MAG: hypothetical protein K0R43_1729 [Pseudoduganella sp.]|jgi:hypothetical protein|nr:hypothetical protein [Pseudoduganella sp.]
MEDYPKLEAAYRAMSKEKRQRIIELAQAYAVTWPAAPADQVAQPARASHLRVVHSANKR